MVASGAEFLASADWCKVSPFAAGGRSTPAPNCPMRRPSSFPFLPLAVLAIPPFHLSSTSSSLIMSSSTLRPPPLALRLLISPIAILSTASPSAAHHLLSLRQHLYPSQQRQLLKSLSCAVDLRCASRLPPRPPKDKSRVLRRRKLSSEGRRRPVNEGRVIGACSVIPCHCQRSWEGRARRELCR